MRRARILAVALIASTGVAACNLQPALTLPATPVPSALPSGGVYPAASTGPVVAVEYKDVVADARLRALIAQGLADNRDLRVAAANIVAARAQYRTQRAAQAPAVDLKESATQSDAGRASGASRSYSVDVGVSSFELDFFGRLRSLSDASLDRYLATDAAGQATRITLIADIADAWSAYAANKSLLTIAEATAENARTSVRLTQARLSGGVAPRTDLRQAEQTLATAEADIAIQRTAVAQDLNALHLLVGGPVDPALLPAGIDDTNAAFLVLPAGTDSSVLLRRPDVIQAEYGLRAANADIGAARAAMFPSITLTGLAGVASSALSALFSGGGFTWSAGAGVALPLFDGGAGLAGVAYSKAQRDAALATYEKAIQSAFRDTADALARQGTIEDQLAAQRTNLAAAQDEYALADARYRGGVDSFLTDLVAQRSLYGAQQSLVSVQLTRAVNRMALYRALGGN